jgi:hypothetical protein
MKVTEEANGKRYTVVIPAEALKDVTEALARLVEYEGTLPAV